MHSLHKTLAALIKNNDMNYTNFNYINKTDFINNLCYSFINKNPNFNIQKFKDACN